MVEIAQTIAGLSGSEPSGAIFAPFVPPLKISSRSFLRHRRTSATHFFLSTRFTLASYPKYAMGTRPPTLTEVLVDMSSPPWTLSAFVAYLSQNHCMETLEFTFDARRYAATYSQFLLAENPRSRDGNERACALWEELMQDYIIPRAPREVNVPACVRDHLLNLPPGPSPPHPSELDEANRIVYELMNDSLLVPFLESVGPMQLENPADTLLQTPCSAQCQQSGDNSPTTMEPMTPPTTPPASEQTFAMPAGGSQCTVAAHNNGWKKVGARLGLTRKSFRRRSTHMSSAIESEPSESEARHRR